MAENFTNAYIGYQKGEDKEVVISDSKVTGLKVRISPAGGKVYYLYYKIKGKQRRYRIGKHGDIGVPDARKQAIKLHGQIVNGVDPQAERMTEREALSGQYKLRRYLDEEYFPHVDSMLRAPEATRYIIEHNFGRWMKLDLDAIDERKMAIWVRDEVKRGIGANTINRAIQGIKAVLNHAVKHGATERNNVDDFKILKLDKKGVVRHLSENEESALVRSCKNYNGRTGGKHMRTFIMLLLDTGLRPKEARHLVWSDIDLKGGTLVVQGMNSKSGQTRHIPLASRVSSELARWLEIDGGEGLVFKGWIKDKPIYNVQQSWSTIRDDAGIKDFRMYDLRHTFASKLVMRGVDLYTVSQLLGHASIEMTQIYAHLSSDHLANAVRVLD